METKNFKEIAAINADCVIVAEYFVDCIAFDFTGWTFVTTLYDFFGNDTGVVATVSVLAGVVTMTIPANSVTYAPAIFKIVVIGTDGIVTIELIRALISYQN